MMHTAESYASEWATLTGRSESEVYIPVALRGPEEPALDESYWWMIDLNGVRHVKDGNCDRKGCRDA